MTNRLAVLMTVYRAQKDFEDTMESLAASTIPCSVMVVDDGSDPPLRVGTFPGNLEMHHIRLPENQGVEGAGNAGLRALLEMGYEYIAIIDAGDYAAPTRLAKQMEYFAAHPNCMLVGSDTEVRDETGAYCFTIEPPRDPRKLAAALHERMWLIHPGIMFRAQVIREAGFYSDRYRTAHDFELILRIASHYEVGVIPETLLTYIVRRDSMSGRNPRTQLISRLRIQLRYFQWTNRWSYTGVLRTVLSLVIPQRLKSAMKLRFFYAKRVPQTELR
jgi:glycosyltransferase involved in cell wall biosynthesis